MEDEKASFIPHNSSFFSRVPEWDGVDIVLPVALFPLLTN